MKKIDEKTVLMDSEKFASMDLRVYFDGILTQFLEAARRGCDTLVEPHLIYRNQGMAEATRFFQKLLDNPIFYFKTYKPNDQSADKAPGPGDLK